MTIPNITAATAAAHAAAAAANLGRPAARKTGRNPKWPHVPIIDHGTHTTQIRAKAFATRQEALNYAERQIEHERAVLADQLTQPRYRALREHHGLPTEWPVA